MTRKTPDNVKALRGTDRPCRAVGVVLTFPEVTAVPPAPEWLGSFGVEYWNRICPILVDRRSLTIADYESIEVMCILYQKVRQSVAAGVDLNASSVTQLRLYQTEFGLTLASRTKLKAGDDGSKGNKFTGNGKKKT